MLVICSANATTINNYSLNGKYQKQLSSQELGRMHQPASHEAEHPRHNALYRVQNQCPHLLRSTVRADTRISYYLRILDYLHDFVIEEEDFREAWLKLGGY